MRRALVLILSTLVSTAAVIGCSPGTNIGGNGGGGGSGGSDDECSVAKPCPEDQRCDPDEHKCVTPPTCMPECGSGFHCEDRVCLQDYTLAFIDPPAKSSVHVRLVLEVRPAPGVEPIEASKIQITSDFNGIVVPAPTLTPIEGQDNRWQMNFDVSTIRTNVSDGVPLTVNATLQNMNDLKVTRRVNVDNKPPDLHLDPPGSAEIRRDRTISFRASVSEANAQGIRVFAYLTGKDQAAPEPAPLGWAEGTLDETNPLYWKFTIDQRSPITSLEGIAGKLDVHLWASDLYGNAAQVVVPNAFNVTRRGWDGDIGNPKPAAPAVLPDGRVAVLVLTLQPSGKALSLFDENGGKIAISVNNLGTAYAPVVGDDGALYFSTTQTVLHAAIDGTKLQEPPAYNCTMPNLLSSKPVLARVDGQEVAVVTLGNKTMAALSPNCTVQATEALSSTIFNSTPAVGADAAGDPVAYIGGPAGRTLSAYSVASAGLTRLALVTPNQYENLVSSDLAIDGMTVLGYPQFHSLMASLDFAQGFGQNPQERVQALAGVSTTAAVSPVVSSTLVVFPTNKGLMSLPRKGAWSKPVIYQPDHDFRATPVVGEGDVVYAIDYNGLVHAVAYTEVNGPELKPLWTAQLGETGETFSAPLTLTCQGMLVAASEQGKVHAIITDSHGLDTTAPWPKYQHDVRNTGDTSTDISCE
jgi:hypothetical protein